jgi:hypothetical protein
MHEQGEARVDGPDGAGDGVRDGFRPTSAQLASAPCAFT